MGYKDIINELKPFDYSKYEDISSYEKLMLYTALIIERKGIPLTFNYLCISAFKLFPDVFCCDEEFKEFPSVDRLNRTMMHVKYVQNGQPFLVGSVKDGYSFTKLGKAIAEDVESIINSKEINTSSKAPVVDKHKKGFSRDYIMFVSGEKYKKYLKTGEVDLMYIWEFFGITPYTQLKTTKNNLKNILEYSNEKKDKKCIEFIKKALEMF